MVTSFYEGYNKMFQVKCEVICFLTWWVNTHFGITPFVYNGKRTIRIPFENEVINDVEYYDFYGLKSVDGTLFVGIHNNNYDYGTINWKEIDDTYGTDNVLTMSALWNIMEILYLYDEKDIVAEKF